MYGIDVLVKEKIEYEASSKVDFTSLRNILADISPLYPNFEAWLNFTFRRNLNSDERQLILAYSGNQIAGVDLLKNTLDKKKSAHYIHALNLEEKILVIT